MGVRKVALVTGASRGIGAATATFLAGKGYKVAVTGRSVQTPSHEALKGTLNALVADIKADGGEREGSADHIAKAYEMDVRCEQQIQRVVKDVVADFGRLDVVIQNAGAVYTSTEVSPRQYDLMHAINTRGALLCASAALPHLVESKGQMVFIAPPLLGAMKWLPRSPPAYSTTKYAQSLVAIAYSGHVKSNALWPKKTIATAATQRLEAAAAASEGGTRGSNENEFRKHLHHHRFYTNGRNPEYFAACIYELLHRPVNGQCLLDEDLLRHEADNAPDDAFI